MRHSCRPLSFTSYWCLEVGWDCARREERCCHQWAVDPSLELISGQNVIPWTVVATLGLFRMATSYWGREGCRSTAQQREVCLEKGRVKTEVCSFLNCIELTFSCWGWSGAWRSWQRHQRGVVYWLGRNGSRKYCSWCCRSEQCSGEPWREAQVAEI